MTADDAATRRQHGPARSLEALWYSDSPLVWLLLPLSLLYWVLTGLRKACYRIGLFKSNKLDVPVVVVGNITAGGAGKTPVVIWLARQLAANGYKPGIVSRGYGGKRRSDLMAVTADSDPSEAGDEPVLIARSTGFPVQVCSRRTSAALALLSRGDVDVIVADDGLQHYALRRDVELAVVDGERRLGNRWLLPAGPLREPASRLLSVDQVLHNGGADSTRNRFVLVPGPAVNLRSGEQKALAEFSGQAVQALAGIGNPQRFYTLLGEHGISSTPLDVPDHGKLADSELPLTATLLMTEKDAIKYDAVTGDDWWYVPVRAVFEPNNERELLATITAKLRTSS